jgi:hypothetical protein
MIKIPKQVRICGIDWDIKVADNKGEGYCDFKVFTITLHNNKPDRMIQVLWHEIREIIQDYHRTRYTHMADNGAIGAIFVFTHQQLETMAEEEFNVIRTLFCGGK